jgi:hypothetical protein
LLVAGAAAVVGMLGFAAWTALRASNSNKTEERAPKVVDASAVPKGPELALPAPSAASKYPGRRSVAGDGSTQPVPDAFVASFEPTMPEPEVVVEQPTFTEEPPSTEPAMSDDTLLADAPPPDQWLDAPITDAPIDESFDPEAGSAEQQGLVEAAEMEEVDSAEDVPEVDTYTYVPPVSQPPIPVVEPIDEFDESVTDLDEESAEPVVVAPAELATNTAPRIPVGAPPPETTDAAKVASTPEKPIEVVADTSSPAAVRPAPDRIVVIAPAPTGEVKPEPTAGPTTPIVVVSAPTTSSSTPVEAPRTTDSATPPVVGEVVKPVGDVSNQPEPVVAKSGETPPPVEVAKPATTAPKSEKSTDAGGLRRASAVDMASIWTETAIPFDAVAGPKRILTPSVGKVRVILLEKQVFEGLLYSVGMNEVTLTTDLGRIGIAGERIEKMERIDIAKVDPAKAAAENVRIKTPGGIVVGKVVSADAGQTVVMTSDGSRVTFASKDIQIQTGAKVGIKP